jgi:hypothetical protein
VRRLMRENDLNPLRKRRFARTTDSDHDGPIFPFVARGTRSTAPTSSGWPTSPTSRSGRASSISRSSSTPGRGGS